MAYQPEVGMINYFQGKSLIDIYMEVHQTARFCNNPILSHEKSIKHLGIYLLHTKKEGIKYNSTISKGLECHVDADFAGGWSGEVGNDADNVMSRTGMVIIYTNFPVYWRSSLQAEIAPSTAEA